MLAVFGKVDFFGDFSKNGMRYRNSGFGQMMRNVTAHLMARSPRKKSMIMTSQLRKCHYFYPVLDSFWQVVLKYHTRHLRPEASTV